MASEWTIDTLKTHHDALVLLNERFQTERDRRYAEVSAEREKALKIKEQADRDALELARQIQTYKDEQANRLREQINSERGLYATKDDLIAITEKWDATIRPIVSFVASQQGRSIGLNASWGYLLGTVTLIGGLIVIFVFLR